jgi:hypothetical protein
MQLSGRLVSIELPRDGTPGLELDCSNGIELDSNRCYSSGQLEFFNGDISMEQLIEAQTSALRAATEKLGVPFKVDVVAAG